MQVTVLDVRVNERQVVQDGDIVHFQFSKSQMSGNEELEINQYADVAGKK